MRKFLYRSHVQQILLSPFNISEENPIGTLHIYEHLLSISYVLYYTYHFLYKIDVKIILIKLVMGLDLVTKCTINSTGSR